MDFHGLISIAPYAERLAYLDPGSGSFILQLLIATVVGGLFIVKGYWSKIRSLFTRKGQDGDTDHTHEK